LEIRIYNLYDVKTGMKKRTIDALIEKEKVKATSRPRGKKAIKTKT